jgi:putative membrane-bound dehydrogenase-like protein
MAVLVLLGIVGLTWRFRTIDLAVRSVCQKNLKDLFIGFHEYILLSNQLPAAARLGDPKEDDWVHWQRDRRFESSAIAKNMLNFSGEVLWCPADAEAGSRDYAYSFSMNANLDRADPAWMGNPQSLILLYEEEYPNDGAFAAGSESDVLTKRHFGRGSALFFDGHVELTTRGAARKPDYSRPVERPPGDLRSGGLAPTEAVGAMKAPDGFHISLFASEPEVKQPIAFSIDDRGRLWVAECYTYPQRQGAPPSMVGAAGKLNKEQLADIFGSTDRILIFEDTDGDGRFDKRTVFLDKLNFVSGVEVGFGGVWIGAVPYLMFVPVKDWDNPKPAGDPQILLDGWDYTQDKTHTLLNTFTWGPDGWLYGCHGGFSMSNVGKPGTPKEQRQWVDAAVWRYHPTKHVFEVFAEGLNNPWGIDFDGNGQCFTVGNVMPHLFHMVQGGRYERIAGQHYPVGAEESRRFAANMDGNSDKTWHPFIYDDIKTIADHLHYRGNQWNERDRHSSEDLGGGHAHAGLLIYQGDNWPEAYHGKFFMNNIHGARINMDIPQRAGSGCVARHGEDFINFHDTWSQVLNLRTGPDGSVFMIDWYDKEQCHEKDPTRHDRSNGRIYKVSYDKPKATKVDLQKLRNEELAELLMSNNSWHVRNAMRLLQERFANNPDLSSTASKLLTPILGQSRNQTHRLHALWALHLAANAFSSSEITFKYMKDDDEYIRAWTIQFAFEDRNVNDALLVELSRLAREDESPVVRLYIASALQRLPISQRGEILEGLLAHAEDATDHNLPLMYWFAAEPLVSRDLAAATGLLAKAKIPQIREYITRKMAGGYSSNFKTP